MTSKTIRCKYQHEFQEHVERLLENGDLDHEIIEWLLDNDGMKWLFRIEQLTVRKTCYALPESEPDLLAEALVGTYYTLGLADFNSQHIYTLIGGLEYAKGPLKDALIDLTIAKYETDCEDTGRADATYDMESARHSGSRHAQPVDAELIRKAGSLADQKSQDLKESYFRELWAFWKKQYLDGKVSFRAIEEFMDFIAPLTKEEVKLFRSADDMGHPVWLPSELK